MQQPATASLPGGANATPCPPALPARQPEKPRGTGMGPCKIAALLRDGTEPPRWPGRQPGWGRGPEHGTGGACIPRAASPRHIICPGRLKVLCPSRGTPSTPTLSLHSMGPCRALPSSPVLGRCSQSISLPVPQGCPTTCHPPPAPPGSPVQRCSLPFIPSRAQKAGPAAWRASPPSHSTASYLKSPSGTPPPSLRWRGRAGVSAGCTGSRRGEAGQIGIPRPTG